MNDTGRLIEEIGERAPFPGDAFERMLRRRDAKRRNTRVAAACVGLAIVAAAAVAIAWFDRPPQQDPVAPPAPLDEITFWFDYDGVVPHHGRLYVDGVEVPGETANTPEEVYRYEFDPEASSVVVAAGTPILVKEREAPDGIRGWIDACCISSDPLQRLYELDLAGSPAMPTEPGSYVAEFHVPDGPGAYFTLLYPIHVAAPEDMGVLTFSFEPYLRNQLVSVSGVDVPGQVDSRVPSSGANYEFVPEGTIEVPPGARIVLDDDPVEVTRGYVDECCDRERAPERLYELALPDAARMPTEPGEYYVELVVRFTCPDCQDEPVAFLFPVRVVVPTDEERT